MNMLGSSKVEKNRIFYSIHIIIFSSNKQLKRILKAKKIPKLPDYQKRPVY